MMYKQFIFGTSEIDYILLRSSKMKSVKITVEFEHGVEVIAPVDVSDQSVEEMLRRKGRWIMKKLNGVAAIEATPLKKEFVSGEKYLYLGRQYTLVVEQRPERRPSLIMHNNKFEVTVSPEMKIWDRQQSIRELFRDWYKKRADDKLKLQLCTYADSLNLQPTEIKVMDMDHRWGSCTPRGVIHLNWRLIMAPIPIIDYLVVHELCHLHIPGHSPSFWNMIGSIIADYEDRREWLRNNGPSLTV